MKHLQSTAWAIGTVLAMLAGSAQAQQVPIPQTAAQVLGPALGPMTEAYVQMVGRMARSKSSQPVPGASWIPSLYLTAKLTAASTVTPNLWLDW